MNKKENNMFQLKTDAKVDAVFKNYPDFVKPKMHNLRLLIIDVAKNTPGICSMEETLKWGEPSYLVNKGSTVRIDWKPKKPDQYAIYFKCTSKLVPTFKTVFKDVFEFEGHRAIVFKIDDKIPEHQLKKCIKAALKYHKVKHLPLLEI